MNPSKTVVCCLIAPMVLLTLPWPIFAGQKRRDPVPPQAPSRPAYVLENCDLPTVLKMLANEAHVSIDVDSSIQGTVNMQIDDMDAKAAIGVIAASENLRLQTVDGMYHVKPAVEADDAHKSDVKSPNDPFEAFAQALTKAIDGITDSMSKPELLEKLAKQKRNYYLALTKEGFTSDEALRIVVASSNSELPTFGAPHK